MRRKVGWGVSPPPPSERWLRTREPGVGEEAARPQHWSRVNAAPAPHTNFLRAGAGDIGDGLL